jgi:hypothetical protein
LIGTAILLGAASSGVGSVVLGVLLLAIGVVIVANIGGVTARFRSFQDRFYSAAPLWVYRSIGLFGIVGGAVIIIAAI